MLYGATREDRVVEIKEHDGLENLLKPGAIEAESKTPGLTRLPQYRAGNRLKIRVPSIFQSLFGWFRSHVFTGRMISVGTPSASYRTLWSGSGVALRRIRRTPFWSVGRTIVAIS